MVIEVQGVAKKYCASLRRSMRYGVSDIIRNACGMSSRPETLRPDEFWAVRDISLHVQKGQTLGIVGHNGSGKTTILKMLSGIFWPDKGHVTVRGRVGSLIDIGAGFHPYLSGRENIYVQAAILGMDKPHVDRVIDDIIAFADIGAFIDSPVKFYSSGMFVRLGFAVAVHSEPDILLVDEVLAVGDYAFQGKCFDRIRRLKQNGTTIVLVSQDTNKIVHHADSALMLHKGMIAAQGSPMDVLRQYRDSMSRQHHGQAAVACPQIVERFGSGAGEITAATLCDAQGNAVTELCSGVRYALKLRLGFREEVQDPLVGCVLTDDSGLRLCNTYSLLHEQRLGTVRAGEEYEVVIGFSANFLRGNYALTPALSYPDGLSFLDYRNAMITFSVNDHAREEGIVSLNSTFDIRRTKEHNESAV